jgi:transcriptional regulator of acetoin/glycerol metabolism
MIFMETIIIYRTLVIRLKKKVIMQALDKTDGNIEEVIKLLGISRKTYFNLKKKLGI